MKTAIINSSEIVDEVSPIISSSPRTTRIKSRNSISIVKKEFRLIDFNIYDEKEEEEENDSSSSEDGNNNREQKPKYRSDNSKFVIQMFGLNEIGETCCLYLDEYYPFFYIRVGKNWKENNLNILMLDIKRRIGKFYQESILDYELLDSEKLYGFANGQKSRFIKINFKNIAVMNKVKNLWYSPRIIGSDEEKKRIEFISQSTILELYESNIPPILRYFHIYGISPSGWISINLSKVRTSQVKTTTCTFEYICKPSQIIPLPLKETIVPYKICSFDIEASSSHGDFPIPKKTYKRLSTNIIDYFIKQHEATQILEPEFSKKIFQNCINAAFGFARNSLIDIVYPKIQITKKELEKIIIYAIKFPITSTTLATSQDIVELLTIDAIFTQMASSIEPSEGDNADEDDNTNIIVNKKLITTKKKKADTQIKQENTIIDLLLEKDTHTRDERIQIMNELLTSLFPRLEGDKATFIGSTFIRYGEKEPYRNHCIVLNTCDTVEGVEIISVEKEEQLLITWAQLIQEENPDIIIGYNIFGFDYEFMFRRAEELNCTHEFLQLSRKIGEVCMNQKTTPPTIETKKIVLASGEYNLKFPLITGRVQIDLYCYFRREFNLPSYKLDDVAGQNISDDIKSVEYCIETHTTKLITQNTIGLHRNDYIHIELLSFTTDYYDDGKKFIITNITENYIEIDGDLSVLTTMSSSGKTFRWCIAKDDVSPQDIFRLTAGTSQDRARVAKYCIKDCNLVQHLMKKIDIITGFIEMSSICSVPISFLIFRGQGIKLTSFVAKKCREKNILMPDLEKSTENDGFEGAIVLPPKCSMYMDNPVACVDYSSLYPSSMISQNLSHDSKVWTKEYDLKNTLIRETGDKDNSTGLYIYDNLEGYEYIDIEFDTFEYRRKNITSSADKVKIGKKVCRWAQFPHGKYGVMPSILKELLGARAATRKKIKTETDPFIQNILDKRQLGYKVTANSLYGQCGAKTSTFYEKDIAASTTATGRMMIIYAKTVIEEAYNNRVYERKSGEVVLTNAEYVYGDSVASYTPILVRVNKHFNYIYTIEELAEKHGYGNKWVSFYNKEKENKEFCEIYDVESWTDAGWTKISRVIRHKLDPRKKMMRILTHVGLVDVTDDHSLLTRELEAISPKDACIGTELLHRKMYIDDSKITCDIMTLSEARIIGNIWGKESIKEYHITKFIEINKSLCDILHEQNREVYNDILPTLPEHQIAEYQQSHLKSNGRETISDNILDEVNTCHNKIIPNNKNKIISYFDSAIKRTTTWLSSYKNIDKNKSHKLYEKTSYSEQNNICSKTINAYRTLNKNVLKIIESIYITKRIPSEIFNSSFKVRKSFWEGLCDAYGYKDNNYIKIYQYNQIIASQLFLLADSFGWLVSIKYENIIGKLANNNHDNGSFIINVSKTGRYCRFPCDIIHKQEIINYTGYVYDLTTQNHHFAAGIGNMIVHNTDSVFFTFNLKNTITHKPIVGKEALEITIEIAQDAAKLCSKWLKSPMELSYEKTMMPFILLSKKRYVGMLYEYSATKGKLKYMGLSIKRRDSCDYLKDTYGGILNILMKEQNIIKAVDFLKESLEQLILGNVPMEKLIITKALRSDYKNPSQIAHKVLADRIKQRDEGNAPKSGDRMRFIHFVVENDKYNKKKILQGDKIETPEFILENKLKIDYTFYITNQLMRPLQQLFGLAITDIWKAQKKTFPLTRYSFEISELSNKYPDLEEFMKKKEKYCSEKIKELLFEPVLKKIYDKNNKIQTIDKFLAIK